MPTLREYEAAVQRNPADDEAFVALRKAYRQSQQHDKLITLYEARAQAIEDGPKAAELFYLASELRIDQLSDPEGAEADLANAVARDPAHVRAVSRLKDIYREQGRAAEYMKMLELEAAAVTRAKDAPRIADLQAEMSRLFENHFSRLEKAVLGAQRPARLTPEHLKTIELARRVYRALADHRNVVRLYELELEATTDAKRRADILLALGRTLSEKLEELDAAAQRLSEVIRIRPRDDKALELLAAVYANPNWIGGDGPEKAAGIFFQLARRRQEAADTENAISYLRRAMQVVPGHTESGALLERIYFEANRYHELDRYYRERVQGARSAEERLDFLYKRAQLAEGAMRDLAEAQRIYAEIVTLEAPNGPASEHLAEMYAANRDYAKLAELRERQLGATTEAGERVRLMAELGILYRDRLGDRDQAAVYWHAILQLDAGHPIALPAYSEHFRDKGDWSALVDLLEFSLSFQRAHGAPAAAQLPLLEEIAVLSEKNLGDNERALSAWRRIEELDPQHQRAREAQKRILIRERNFPRIAELLEREIAEIPDPGQKVETQKRLALIYREKLNDPARAAATYRDILAEAPQEPVAFRALVEIYEKSEDHAALVGLFRAQIEITVAKPERVGLLRRLLVLYDEKLGDQAGARWAAAELLKALPGDREALVRLEALLERSEDWAHLVATLEYHVRHPSSAEDRLQILRRLAVLSEERLNDLSGAAARWEEVNRQNPDDEAAIAALIGLYTKLGRWPDVARVRELDVERNAGNHAAQAESLRELGLLSERHLQELPRAVKAWEARLELLPNDGEALEALSRLYASLRHWGSLVRTLERRVALASDPAEAVALALQRGSVFEDQLDEAGEAARTYEQLINELDPRNKEAHDRLRAIYEGMGDWARVVRVADRQLFLTEDLVDRVPRALEIGAIWRDRLNDDRKAIAAYERVLELDPTQLDALQALAALYATTNEPEKLIAIDERLLALTAEPEERERLVLQIAEVAEQRMHQPALAFDWLRRYHIEAPSDAALARLDSFASKHGLFEELVGVYETLRAQSDLPEDQLAAAQRIAEICEVDLNDAARAANVLRDALTADPAGDILLPELERLANVTSDWASLLDVYARVARGRPSVEERVELLRRRADVRENKMGDPAGALDEYLRAFALAPKGRETHDEILRLAGRADRWEDAIRVEGQLFALADTQAEKLLVACRAAQLVEHEVKDLVRAFRAYLNAFRLVPEDEQIVGHLWRLAGAIGHYGDVAPVKSAGAAPNPTEISASALIEEPAEVTIDDDDVIAAEESGPLETEGEEAAAAGEPARDEERLSDDEAAASDDVLAPALADPTEDQAAAEASAEASGGVPDAVAPESTSEVSVPIEMVDEPEVSGPRLPPPPPVSKPPFAGARVRERLMTPFGFATPWEELAQAYESLPANDNGTRRNYLLKIADVWERGAENVDRALAALARAMRLDPRDEVIRRELQRVARTYDRWDRVCKIYLASLDEFSQAADVVDVNYEVAAFREALGQIDEAEQRYRAIVAIAPTESRALERLEEILRDGERWGELGELLERRTGGVLEALPPGVPRRKRLRELAALYEDHLEKPYEALDTLERMLTEASEDERGVDDADVASEMREACEALARLYARVGLWAKVVESLGREVELTNDLTARRELRLRIARVLESELGQGERAIEAYEAILGENLQDEEALQALDRLHESLGHADALQEILEKRAELASGHARVELVLRRARLLEDRLGNPEAAAAALRSLGEDAIADDELAVALVRNLRRAGSSQEAARVLSEKLSRLLASARPDSEAFVNLSLELSTLRLDDLGDLDGAREAISRALTIAPRHPAALAALGRLRLKRNDFVGYAETRLEEARALGQTPEAVEALLDAGRVFQEQARDTARAVACFEEALEVDPRNPTALRALAAARSAAGSFDEALALYQRLLETSDTPEARAAVLTELGRAAWEQRGDLASAQKYLDEALALAPDHIPAVLTAADVFYREGQWELAEKRLTEAVRRLRNQPAQTARLVVRLAEVSEKLGKLDDAYRQLLEADRLTPGQIAIRLALGENRFRAGKWREASQHLGNLADHPDAASLADEVADALAHAAQAEVKLRHPEKALAAYEAALGLRPTHRPSLRALADLALERGERAQALGYLRRLAEATGDRGERALLLEEMGDLQLADVGIKDARATYDAAVALVGTPTDANLSLLEKALDLARQDDDRETAARMSNLVIDLVRDPKERARRRREAALMILDQDEGRHARPLLEAALKDNPEDEEALAALVDVLRKQDELKAARKRLSETLPTLAPVDDAPKAARALRAKLWEAMALLRTRKESAQTVADLEQAIACDPGLVSARRALAERLDAQDEASDRAALNLRALLEADPTDEVTLRRFANASIKRGDHDAAHCALEILILLHGGTEADQAFLDAHPTPSLGPDSAYSAPLEDADRRTLIPSDEATTMAEVFTSLWEGAPGLLTEKLEDFGVGVDQRISPMGTDPLSVVFGQVTRMLGAMKTALYYKPERTEREVALVVQMPPALIVGPELAFAPEGEVRFELGRVLELSRPEYILAAGIRSREFTTFFGNLLKAFHPRHAKRRAGSADNVADPVAHIKRNVPYKVSKRLVELFQEMGSTPWSSARWRKVVGEIGNRIGLLCSGEIEAAVRCVLRAQGLPPDLTAEELRKAVRENEALRDLLRFAVSETYFRLRTKLGTAAFAAA